MNREHYCPNHYLHKPVIADNSLLCLAKIINRTLTKFFLDFSLVHALNGLSLTHTLQKCRNWPPMCIKVVYIIFELSLAIIKIDTNPSDFLVQSLLKLNKP